MPNEYKIYRLSCFIRINKYWKIYFKIININLLLINLCLFRFFSIFYCLSSLFFCSLNFILFSFFLLLLLILLGFLLLRSWKLIILFLCLRLEPMKIMKIECLKFLRVQKSRRFRIIRSLGRFWSFERFC